MLIIKIGKDYGDDGEDNDGDVMMRIFSWLPWWRHQMETFSALLAL